MATPERTAATTEHSGSDSSTARAAVAAALARLSSAWRNRRYDELAAVFDEGIVMALPGFVGRVEGREPLVESYREFMERATLTDYKEQPAVIDVWGDTAVASYRWEMHWLAGGVPNHAAGYEVFVFGRNSEGTEDWRAVWRTMAVDPEVP
jgi:hypothetical protein